MKGFVKKEKRAEVVHLLFAFYSVCGAVYIECEVLVMFFFTVLGENFYIFLVWWFIF